MLYHESPARPPLSNASWRTQEHARLLRLVLFNVYAAAHVETAPGARWCAVDAADAARKLVTLCGGPYTTNA